MNRLWNGAFAALSLGMLAMVLLVAWSVLARNADFEDVTWTEDMSRLILLWVGLLFVPLIQWEDGHIAAEFLHPRSARGRRVLEAVKQLVFLVIGLVWIWYGSIMVYREAGMVGAGGMELPLSWFNSVIPVAGLLVAAVALVRLFAVLGGRALPRGATHDI